MEDFDKYSIGTKLIVCDNDNPDEEFEVEIIRAFGRKCVKFDGYIESIHYGNENFIIVNKPLEKLYTLDDVREAFNSSRMFDNDNWEYSNFEDYKLIK